MVGKRVHRIRSELGRLGTKRLTDNQLIRSFRLRHAARCKQISTGSVLNVAMGEGPKAGWWWKKNGLDREVTRQTKRLGTE